ncbi:MAG: glutathione S-transferase [Robiginitomaculum sp.]|nr:MAG: glutathione S-transferase [Robiginitomaculum sp.]
MKLYTAAFAPNPERVRMFLREKGVDDLEMVEMNIMEREHKSDDYRALSPFAQIPALELDDGRVLTESRAICRYLEGVYPEPNLFGVGYEETAFIEMWDRRVEFMFLLPLAWWIRHGHPAFTAIEKQIAELAPRGEKSFRFFAKWLDGELTSRDFVAGNRFTIADITAMASVGFARVAKWKPDADELPNLLAWRARMLARPCGQKG